MYHNRAVFFPSTNTNSYDFFFAYQVAGIATKLNDRVVLTVFFDLLERFFHCIELRNIVISVFILTTEDDYFLAIEVGE